MRIIHPTTETHDPSDLGLCWHDRGIFLNMGVLRGYGPTVIEMVTLHELYHLIADSNETKAWEYAARNLVRMHGPFIDLGPIGQFFWDHRKRIGGAFELFLDTIRKETNNIEQRATDQARQMVSGPTS
jgi:hypothetical protein